MTTEPSNPTPQHLECATLCPVCIGRGIMPHGFFNNPAGQDFSSSSIEPDKCRPCGGLGIIYTQARHFPAAEAEGRKDTERINWLQQMADECEGRLLTRLFIPNGKPMREKMDALMKLNPLSAQTNQPPVK